MSAQQILQAAAGHMKDRAATYDKPQGERSMAATVTAFRAITGHDLTEEQGWLFMQLLKAVRSQSGAYRADSYEDGAAYVALAGEAAARDRGQSDKAEDDAIVAPRPASRDDIFTTSGVLTKAQRAAIKAVLQPQSNAWEEGSARMDAIARNGNDGEHYGSVHIEFGDDYVVATTKNPNKL